MSEELQKNLLVLENAQYHLTWAAYELSCLVGWGVGGTDIEDLRNAVEKLIDDSRYYDSLIAGK